MGASTKSRHVYTLDAEGNQSALDEYVERTRRSAAPLRWFRGIGIDL